MASRDEGRARAFAERWSVPETEPGYDELLARDDLDLVYIALPNVEHARWSIEASRRGHAVLCEKPMATTLADVCAMVEAGRTAGRPVLEAMHYRHHPLMHALVDMARGGEIGEIVSAEAGFVARLDRSDAVRWDAALGGGALLDLGCYAVHALRSILGAEPTILDAEARMIDGVDASLRGRLDFDGIGASIECSMVADRRAADLRLRGSAGEIIVENFVAPQLGHRVSVRTAQGERTLTFEGPGTFDHQLVHVRDVLAGDRHPLVGGDDATANMAAIGSLHDAARGGEGSPDARQD